VSDHRGRYGPGTPDDTYVARGVPEQVVDPGEVTLKAIPRASR
jgi:hypothetical protein